MRLLSIIPVVGCLILILNRVPKRLVVPLNHCPTPAQHFELQWGATSAFTSCCIEYTSGSHLPIRTTTSACATSLSWRTGSIRHRSIQARRRGSIRLSVLTSFQCSHCTRLRTSRTQKHMKIRDSRPPNRIPMIGGRMTDTKGLIDLCAHKPKPTPTMWRKDIVEKPTEQHRPAILAGRERSNAQKLGQPAVIASSTIMSATITICHL